MNEWAFQLVLGILISIIAYFLKTFRSQLEKNDDHLQKQLDLIKEDVNQYKLEAADRFVLKDDFIRATAITDRKLDKIYDEVIKLNKKNSEDR